MKKILTALITAALLISSAGCQMTQSQATQPAPEPTPQALVLNVTPPAEQHIDVGTAIEQITAGLKIKASTAEKEKEPAQAEKTDEKVTPTAKQDKAQELTKKQAVQQDKPTTEPKAVATTPAPETRDSDTGYLIVKVKATPTPPPAATSAPTPVPTPEPPAPTPEPPAPTPAPVEPVPEPVPSFDIGYWIGYAQSCAQGLGLRLESSAVDCWDNPIGAGPHSTCLERDISTRMNRYASDPDITDVWIWYESIGENSYNIYIGYA